MTDPLQGVAEPEIRRPIIVAIGASAGGFEALIKMFAAANSGGPVAYVIIQHLDPDHESVMADLLNRKTDLEVRQAKHDEALVSGRIYLIPPGTGMRITDDRLQLVPFVEPRGVRRPIDDFFFSLAEDGNHRCAAVILSGTGGDGAMGMQALKESGAVTIVQNPDEAKYDGMPRSAISTGAVDRILDAAQILPEILGILEPGIKRSSDTIRHINEHLSEICHVLRDQTGHDFSGYKRATLLRRIERRMQLIGMQNPSRYIRHLSDSPDEAQGLFRDVLINVTRFFRDTSNFEVLARRAIDPMIASAANGEAIRIWIPGCSTGEEAYTIAMICIHAASHYNVKPLIQIFATDVDESALSIGRLGRYPLSVLQDIPEPYRSLYVDVAANDIQISPRVRDVIRFSNHNLIRDPAFSRMDLISCRNLFIYFNDRTQRTALPLLHFSLKPSGYLFLGPSESIGEFDTLFASIDRHSRLFRKRDVPASYPVEMVTKGLLSRRPRESVLSIDSNGSGAVAVMDASARRILETYAPPTVTLNERGEIISSTRKLARYFEFSGHQGRELAISVAHRGLREILGPLLRTVQSERTRVMRPGVRVSSEFGTQEVDVIADPLSDGHTLLIFIQKSEFEPVDKILVDELSTSEDRLHYLEEELQQMRLRLRATVEELETANEELKSSNEEMMSMNEELQSTNEELTTANDELKIKIDQLDVLNSDLRNFFESADMGVIILSHDLRVRAFTPRVRNLFPLRESDKGRLLSEIAAPMGLDYLPDSLVALDGGRPVERLISFANNNKSYLMRVLPYLGMGGDIDGVTLTFFDVSDLKKSQDDLHQEQQRLRLALQIGKAGVFELAADNRNIRIDAHARSLLRLGNEDHVGDMVDYETFLSCIHEDQRDEVAAAFEKTFKRKVSSLKLIFRVKNAPQETWIRVISDIGDHAIALCQDYTSVVQYERHQEILLREMNHRIKNVFSVIGSILRVTAPQYDDIQSFVQDSRDRIAALSRSNLITQDVTAKSDQILLGDLMRKLLEPYPQQKFAINGPDVSIAPQQAASLSLILHEWTTNAAKYGALKEPDGRVELSWNIGVNKMTIQWKEVCAQPLTESEKTRGFGSQLVEIAVSQLSGSLVQKFEREGFDAELSLPRSAV